MNSFDSNAQMKLDKQIWELTEIPSFKLPLIQALLELNSFANASELANEISHDVALVARILRIANSPFFGMSREITTLQQAVVLLGVNRVRDLLIAFCFPQTFSILSKSFDQQSFWSHCLVVADCARSLAEYCSISREKAFAAGLLHDIGLIVMASLFPEKYIQISDHSLFECNSIENENMLLTQERKIFEGNDHAKIGGRVALLWNFPHEIKEAIEFHAVSPDCFESLSMVVYAANLLSLQRGDELNEDCVDALTRLSIPTDKALSIKSQGYAFAEQIVPNL